MKSSKPQKQVFLTYAHRDKKAIRKLYDNLTENGVKVWLDEKELLPGQDWQYEIRQAILRSDIVIVCLSRQFNKQGGFRHDELKIVLEKAGTIPEGEIFLIPVRLEECRVLQPLSRWQYVDLFEEDGYHRLLLTLRKNLVTNFSAVRPRLGLTK
jgi:TIR domain-containing protein